MLHLLERHASDPREALARAVNDTWDNDTVAAIVGAVVGALHGASAFPVEWRRGLLGRTTASDDGRLSRVYRRLRALGGWGLDDAAELPVGERA